ncbi:MAG: histidine kinase [Mucilaginibacter sp.]|nr:histidine kinase [Mucilaginibacter sp.]
MKKLLFLLPVLMLGLFSCQTKTSPGHLVKVADYRKAESFLYRQNDSAYYYFNKVVASSRDSLQIAMAYNNMAVIQSDAGDYFGSQESLSMSLRFLDEKKEKDQACLSSDYNELGLTSINLKNYEAAIPFYELAIKFSRNEAFKLIFLNNKALALEKKGSYVSALKLYRVIISQTKNEKEYARTLSNMARTQWLYHPDYNAAPELLKALRIRQKENDFWGQNASYAHLADYYTRKRPDSAFSYASQMYTVARRLSSPDDQLEALQKLIRLGPPQFTKSYFDRYQQLNDSVQTSRNAAKNQFAFIRYDVEKGKADNLKLQRDNTEKRYQIARQRVFLFGTLFLLVTGTVISVIWYRKRKQRLDLEAQNKIRESQLKTSKKVHDVVANGLYRMMTEIDNQEGIDKTRLLDRIEDMYEKSRDISYEQPELPALDFGEKLGSLLKAFATERTKVVLAGNRNELWNRVSMPVQYEIEHVLQELMVNMRKHSGASNVAIRFERKGNQIHIYYTDDGIGLPKEVKYKNGLTSTGNRINHIQGAITFETNRKKGLRILISFPVS